MTHNARICPKCSKYNHGGSEFCQICGTDIRTAKPEFLPWAQSNSLPPIASAVRDEGRRFARVDPDAAGSGLVWSGIIIATIGLLLDLTVVAMMSLVGIGAVLAALGLWQLRIDYPALSRLGVWLIGVSVVVLVAVTWRVLEPQAADPARPVSSTANKQDNVGELDLATDGNVLMHRGGPAHLGTNPGPSPAGSLFRSWRFDTGGELYSSPAVSGNILIVGSKSGFLYALNATTGESLWARDLGQYIVRSSPALSDKTIVINNGYQVIALSIDDGSTLWSQDISFAGDTSPTIAGSSVYIASQSGAVYSLALSTGEQEWHIQIDGLLFGSPTVDENQVFVANDRGKVTAVASDSGVINWSFMADGGIFAPIVSDDDTIMFTTNSGKTYKVYSATGKPEWTYDAGGTSGGASTFDTLIVAADNGGVSAIRRVDGQLAWLVPTGSAITVGPTIVGDLVYVASGQTLYGFDLGTGTLKFTYATGYTIQTAPVVVNGTVFIGGRDGYLDAIVGDAT